MSLKEDLKEFGKELTLYKQNQTLPQNGVKNRLADIYEEHYPTNKHWGVSKVDRGCPTCISDFMKCLSAEYFKQQVPFKGIQRDLEDQISEEEKQANVSFINNLIKEEGAIEIVLTEEDSIADLNDEPRPDNPSVHYTELSWGKLKAYASSKGINTKGKKKQDILAELKELDD
jgi:hypothetical protein